MARAALGPIVMSVAGDQFVDGCRLAAILWTGATTAGDTVTVHARNEQGGVGALIWKCRTDSTNTYLGINTGPQGVHLPYGFRLTQIPAGDVLAYLREG